MKNFEHIRKGWKIETPTGRLVVDDYNGSLYYCTKYDADTDGNLVLADDDWRLTREELAKELGAYPIWDDDEITILWRVRTTFLGADRPSEFYFDTQAGAEMNLAHLDNGNVEKVSITSDYPLEYSTGCTLDDLTHGGLIDVDIEEV